MRCLRVDHPGARLGSALRAGRQRQLGAENGRETDFPRRFGEANDPVAAVVIGERERLDAEPRRF